MLLPFVAIAKARIDRDSIIAKVFALSSPDDLFLDEEKRDPKLGRMVVDSEYPYFPESVEILPLDPDTNCFVAMITWGPELTRGLLTDFYEFERMATTLRLSMEGGTMEYGGGTQRYDEAALSDSLWRLGEGVQGFTVKLTSGHFASQSESEELYLFAIMDGTIKEVLNLGVHSQFSALSLADPESNDPSYVERIWANIDEYVPKEHHRDCVCEFDLRIKMGQGTTMGMRDLVVEETKYQLTQRRIEKTKSKETWRWNGYSYSDGKSEF